MIISETETSFYKWYKKRYEKAIDMTYSEMHDKLLFREDKEFLELYDEYRKYISENVKKLWKSEIIYRFPED